MSQERTYSAADKKKLKTWEWVGATATSRAIKMARPQCSECQRGRDTIPNWWEKCEHDPYWSSQRKTTVTPVWVKDEETGEEYLDGETTKTRRIRVPNIIEVPLHDRANSGKGPQLFRYNKGYRLLPDIGLAPMCECHGCGKAWPTVITRLGTYCSEEHAKQCVGDAEGVSTVSYATQDVSKASIDQAKNAVNI